MKKSLFFVLLFIITEGVNAQQLGEIINGGFENWTEETIYESPSNWKSSNTQEYRGIALVSKSTDAFEGTYSAKLEISINGQDSLQGHVFLGNVGQNGPDSGFPYTSTFSDVAVSYKSDLGNDTLNILVIRYVLGNIVGMEVIPVTTGLNNTWQTDTLSVQFGVQDSLFIGFIMGDVNGANLTDGSWALVDKVEMLNNGSTVTALPNFGFENWEATSIENPDNWSTVNEMLIGIQLTNAIKTNDAYIGSYAVEMTTISPPQFGGDTISSFISIGSLDFGSQISPFLPAPYIATPATFTGAYKYTPVNGDQAVINMQFMQGGVVIGQHSEILTAQATYTTFTSNLTISGTPDSIIFFAFSGDNPGSILKLDELQFSGGDLGILETTNQLSIYPNPATNYINISGICHEFDYSIYDMTGKLVLCKQMVKDSQKIDISHLKNGLYFIKIVEGNKTTTQKIIVK